MSDHILKRYKKTLLLYHLVFPLEYGKSVITSKIGETLKRICFEISDRYEVHFVEIGYEPDHVHFWFKAFQIILFQNNTDAEKYYSQTIVSKVS